MTSEAFIRKLNKAHEALSTSADNHRSLSASFGTKWPYKRAMSAPAGMVARTDKFGQFFSFLFQFWNQVFIFLNVFNLFQTKKRFTTGSLLPHYWSARALDSVVDFIFLTTSFQVGFNIWKHKTWDRTYVNDFFSDGNLKEQKDDEMMFLFLLPKIMELEDSDRETMHFLTFLLMQVFSD